ncbi:glycoside hydrolase family 2 TIM barrel-domain containing protein [uncultured Draconibacterium sp.]|uniref:glycoside hydrolase family 2 protein n=1 Tax=uncultured Draconibacterium sp. TaxID=1573823 RepID=UPI0029C9A4DF|nr:glycoside hydrolase family 2 TIM barrel-domain containing protein [uncultured Draconibacterium sp.]
MKLRIVFLVVVLFCLAISTLGAQRIYLSGKDASDAVPWEFKMSTGRNSGFWTTIPVPSNWEQHGFGYYTYGMDHDAFLTDPEIGYYKRTFVLKDTGKNRYRLTFQGAMTDTHVKINGISAGAVHQGGFTQFSYDITNLVKKGENRIEVEVHKSSNSENVQEAERVTDFWLFGGIFRPVYIDILPNEFIERVAINATMDGTFEMDVYTDGMDHERMLTATIFDSEGKPIGEKMEIKVASGNSVSRLSSKFRNIKLWSHELPKLYRVEVKLSADNQVIHSYSQKFGFRTFEVRDHDGFYLNGKRILLKGASLHSFRPKTGRTLSKANIEENFRIMKDLNFNVVRPCHYPPDEYLFELCDSLGLLAMDELTGWHHPLGKEVGSKLVKELISRDVNHPSIILWGNGNHFAHNPALDEDFFRWDIQRRRPLKNTARVETWPGDYDPDFDPVDTRFYPSYEQLVERLSDKHIVLPNEAIHALYDGGGGAGLSDYWKAFKESRVGGGLIIWALFDEGIYRTDLNRIDVQESKAADGLVGPNGEKEGSYFAVKEIWSPVQIKMKELPTGFDGTIEVENDFSFVNLNQCRFEWQLENFAGPYEIQSGARVVDEGVTESVSIPASTNGKLRIKLPADWKKCEALKLKVYDHTDRELSSWAWTIATSQKLAGKLVMPKTVEIKRTGEFQFLIGNNSVSFDPQTGVLREIEVNGSLLPVTNVPFLVAQSSGADFQSNLKKGKVTVLKTEAGYVIESSNNNGFDWFKWEIHSTGSLKLSYEYTLPEGKYFYAGVGMEVPEKDVLSKRWLGKGPYRIWKNRTQGGILNVWDITKTKNIPGQVWNLPEFEGCFSPFYWAVFRLTNHQNVALATPGEELVLGVLNPQNGEDPKLATWYYPEKEGIYLFNCISPVGGKWKEAREYGPSSQATEINETCKGSFQVQLFSSLSDSEIVRKVKEIE